MIYQSLQFSIHRTRKCKRTELHRLPTVLQHRTAQNSGQVFTVPTLQDNRPSKRPGAHRKSTHKTIIGYSLQGKHAHATGRAQAFFEPSAAYAHDGLLACPDLL